MAVSNSTNSPHFETSAKPSAIFSSRNQQFKRRAPPRCKSSEPLDTPCCLRTPRNSSKTPARKNPPVCDRFIPVRKGVDHELNSYKLLESLGNSEATQTGGDDMKSDFQKHLEKQLLEKEYKILAFRTKPPKTGNVAGTLKTLYSMNKVTAPKKMSRHIPQNAERVLDAPELIDDYYLNLLDWNNDGVISIALGPSVYLYNAATASVAHLFDMTENGHEGEYVSSLSYHKSGNILAVGNSRKEVQLWDMTRQKRLRTMTGHTGRVSSLSWNEPFLTSASLKGNVHHHDVRISTHCVTMIPAHYGEVCGLKWSPDGRHLATGSNDNIIKIWTGIDGISTTPLHCLTNHVAAIKALAWCPWQSSLLASGAGTADKCIKFWNVVTGQCLNSVDTKSQVCGLLWSAEHRELISGHGLSQNQLSIWKYPTMTKVCELMGHTGRILHMCCSPDKTTVASLGADETLRLWHCFQVDETKKILHAKKGGRGVGSTLSISYSRIR